MVFNGLKTPQSNCNSAFLHEGQPVSYSPLPKHWCQVPQDAFISPGPSPYNNKLSLININIKQVVCFCKTAINND